MKLMTIFLSLFLAFSSFAKTTILDPQNILGQMDTFMGFVPFEQTFQIGQESKYFHECLFEGCQLAYDHSSYSVLNMSKDAVLVKIVTDETIAVIVDKSEYDASNGNILRFLFASTENLKFFLPKELFNEELTTITFKQVTFTRGTFLGKSAEQAIVSIVAYHKNTDGGYEMEYPLVYTITKGVPFVAQASKVAIPGLVESSVIELK